MPVTIRPAVRSDARGMADLLNALIRLGGTTAYRQPFGAEGIASTFIEPNFGICCFCAEDGDAIVGFQALEWADPDWPGPARLPADWAIIATFVAADRHGEGIGGRLFAATLATARAMGVRRIDATIRGENVEGLGYYDAMGFRDYRVGEGRISKVFHAD